MALRGTCGSDRHRFRPSPVLTQLCPLPHSQAYPNTYSYRLSVAPEISQQKSLQIDLSASIRDCIQGEFRDTSASVPEICAICPAGYLSGAPATCTKCPAGGPRRGGAGQGRAGRGGAGRGGRGRGRRGEGGDGRSEEGREGEGEGEGEGEARRGRGRPGWGGGGGVKWRRRVPTRPSSPACLLSIHIAVLSHKPLPMRTEHVATSN